MNKFIGPMLLITAVCLPGCATLKTAQLPFRNSRKTAEQHERVISIARLMERNGKAGDAQKLYQEIVKQDPKHSVAHHRLGILAARRGEHQEALEAFAQARQTGGDTVELRNDIGYTQYLLNDLAAAEQTLREALAMDPQFAAASSNLALVLAEQGRDEESLVEFRKSVSESVALANLAYIQAKLGKFAEAEKNYHRCLDLDPSHRAAAEALVQFQSARNRGEAILARLERQQLEGGQGMTQVAAAETDAPTSVASQKADDLIEEISVRNQEERHGAHRDEPVVVRQTARSRPVQEVVDEEPAMQNQPVRTVAAEEPPRRVGKFQVRPAVQATVSPIPTTVHQAASGGAASETDDEFQLPFVRGGDSEE